MANQWGYDEKFMQEQNHPLWRNDLMKPSKAKLGPKGCFITNVRYAKSRIVNKMYGVKEVNQQMSIIVGYTENGDAKWDAVKKVLGLTISKAKPSKAKSAIITMRNVLVRDINNNFTSHWVTELKGGLMYDPLKTGGNFVHRIDFFAPVFAAPGLINRRYVYVA